jgi:hypothetical protein
MLRRGDSDFPNSPGKTTRFRPKTAYRITDDNSEVAGSPFIPRTGIASVTGPIIPIRLTRSLDWDSGRIGTQLRNRQQDTHSVTAVDEHCGGTRKSLVQRPRRLRSFGSFFHKST